MSLSISVRKMEKKFRIKKIYYCTHPYNILKNIYFLLNNLKKKTQKNKSKNQSSNHTALLLCAKRKSRENFTLYSSILALISTIFTFKLTTCCFAKYSKRPYSYCFRCCGDACDICRIAGWTVRGGWLLGGCRIPFYSTHSVFVGFF